MSEPGATGDAAFDAAAEATASDDVHETTMFGCRTLLADDKMFACLYHGALAVRLGAGSESSPV